MLHQFFRHKKQLTYIPKTMWPFLVDFTPAVKCLGFTIAWFLHKGQRWWRNYLASWTCFFCLCVDLWWIRSIQQWPKTLVVFCSIHRILLPNYMVMIYKPLWGSLWTSLYKWNGIIGAWNIANHVGICIISPSEVGYLPVKDIKLETGADSQLSNPKSVNVERYCTYKVKVGTKNEV